MTFEGIRRGPAALLLAAIVCASPCSQAAVKELKLTAPRPFGYVIGDIIEHRISLVLDHGFELDPASIPEPGRASRLLALNEVELESEVRGGEPRHSIRLRYQIVNAPASVTGAGTPHLSLRVLGPEGDLPVVIPAWGFTVGPIVAPEERSAGRLPSLRPALAPPPIPTDAHTARVVALDKPSDVERGQWYFQRYIQHLPTVGEMVLFDRSRYNRAGVERVMGFCTGQEYLEFLRQCPEMERMLVNSGILLFKFYFSVSQDEQAYRFERRSTDPLKQWKISPVDLASLNKWDGYTQAKEAMFFYTDTADAPWTVIKSDDKKRARIAAMQFFLSRLDYPDKDHDVVTGPDPLIAESATVVVSRDEPMSAEGTPGAVIGR